MHDIQSSTLRKPTIILIEKTSVPRLGAVAVLCELASRPQEIAERPISVLFASRKIFQRFCEMNDLDSGGGIL